MSGESISSLGSRISAVVASPSPRAPITDLPRCLTGCVIRVAITEIPPTRVWEPDMSHPRLRHSVSASSVVAHFNNSRTFCFLNNFKLKYKYSNAIVREISLIHSAVPLFVIFHGNFSVFRNQHLWCESGCRRPLGKTKLSEIISVWTFSLSCRSSESLFEPWTQNVPGIRNDFNLFPSGAFSNDLKNVLLPKDVTKVRLWIFFDFEGL